MTVARDGSERVTGCKLLLAIARLTMRAPAVLFASRCSNVYMLRAAAEQRLWESQTLSGRALKLDPEAQQEALPATAASTGFTLP